MNGKLNIADIISKLNETEELIQNKNISGIDRDLLLEKIRRIYEKVLTDNFNTVVVKEVTPKVEEIIVTQEPVQEIKKVEPVKETIIQIEEKKEITEPVIIPVEEKTEVIEPEKLIEEPVADDKKNSVNNPTLFDVEEVKETPKTKTTSKTVSDQYQSHSGKTLSDAFSKSKPENDLTSKIQLKPIKSIKSAISINDRIMFTKELFDNDPDYYNEIIEKINNMKNLAEALEFLAVEVEIEEDSDTLKKFVELIHRRFA